MQICRYWCWGLSPSRGSCRELHYAQQGLLEKAIIQVKKLGGQIGSKLVGALNKKNGGGPPLAAGSYIMWLTYPGHGLMSTGCIDDLLLWSPTCVTKLQQ